MAAQFSDQTETSNCQVIVAFGACLRAKQEMGWSNFEGATFVRKMGIFLGFDITDKTNAQLKEQTRKFICDNFNIQCIEHPLEDDLLFHEKELIRKLQPCLNDKKNK